MAMTMNGEVHLRASREVVWEKLNDPAVLRKCIPGCEELARSAENQFQAVAKMKVGPVSARFGGRVTLSDLDPPNGYRISGEGEGGGSRFRQGRRDRCVGRERWRHFAQLYCRGADRREAGATGAASDQRLRKEAGRSVLRQFSPTKFGLPTLDGEAKKKERV